MNYLLISPNFPKSQEYFAKRLCEKGITVLGIGTESYDELSPRLQEVITEYFKVNNLEDYNEVLKAVAFLTYKHGKIDRVESNNEYWLELDAKIREDFNIGGVKPSQLSLTKYKSRMKDVFRNAGARVVEGLSISNKEELAPTIETLGLPVIAKPDNGVGADNTYKLFTQEDVENFRNIWDESVSYFLEQYIDNAVLCTYDGLIDSEGNVVFDKVKFGYVEDQIIIKNFTSDVKKGEMVAIVGPTGAGKTTMIKLLMRFYDINGGSIYIDGKDISKLDRSELRSYFTMVLQDTWLFKGTIMENLRYGRLDATDEEVIEAAKAAHIHHFIKTLPGGYNMELNEDASNISQGQKQLLTIARAILADKPILILDEATSSVDTRTEVLIQKAMNKLMEGRTTFVIAHRLSTIRNADKILVLKDGDIIEQGNHDELLEQKGFYSELYQSQFAE